MTVKPKSYQEHLAYLHDIVRLKLWFVWTWARTETDKTFEETLQHRVDLFRKTGICRFQFPEPTDFGHPDWQALESASKALFHHHRDDPDADAFEHASFEVFRPAVDLWSRAHCARPVAEGFQCGSLKYDPPTPIAPRRVMYHIANALQPLSLFEDPTYLPRCFMDLMEKSEAEHGAEALITGTWLNSHPRWQQLSPREYLEQMSPPELAIGNTANHWGQFINARGTFHAPRAAKFRESGQLPYPSRMAWCNFTPLRGHLKRFL